jgi:hypothetical protein
MSLTTYGRIADSPSAQLALANAASFLDSADLHAYRAADDADSAAGPSAQQRRIRLGAHGHRNRGRPVLRRGGRVALGRRRRRVRAGQPATPDLARRGRRVATRRVQPEPGARNVWTRYSTSPRKPACCADSESAGGARYMQDGKESPRFGARAARYTARVLGYHRRAQHPGFLAHGRVTLAYRHHPRHGRAISQDVVGDWLDLTQPQPSRIESGRAIGDRGRRPRRGVSSPPSAHPDASSPSARRAGSARGHPARRRPAPPCGTAALYRTARSACPR